MKFCDNHNDFLTELKTEKEISNYINKINKDKNLKYVCAVIWTSKIKKPLKVLKDIYDKYFLTKTKLLFCIEDLGFINKKNLSESLSLLIKLKPFYCGLVWNNDNLLGGGAYGKKSLTKLGKVVIQTLEKNKILIDTAHMNKKTFYGFAKISNFPIYNSHSNLTFFKADKRNLNLKQIKTIVNSKGLICLSFVQAFIFDYLIDLQFIIKQTAYLIAKIGDNNISFGSDFYGTKKLPIDLTRYENLKKLRFCMIKEGISQESVDKIFYKNFLNFKNKIKN